MDETQCRSEWLYRFRASGIFDLAEDGIWSLSRDSVLIFAIEDYDYRRRGLEYLN
jgi:hypothetical protein